MAPFDPYHKWLGIPPAEQPPNHYRLLAIPQFEPDLDVIEAAAERQTVFLRTFQSGAHVEVAEALLNEVSAARICLLTPAEKTQYDQQLRRQLPPTVPPAGPSKKVSAVPKKVPAATVTAERTEPAEPSLVIRAEPRKHRKVKPFWQRGAFPVVVVGVVLLVMVIVITLGWEETSEPVAERRGTRHLQKPDDVREKGPSDDDPVNDDPVNDDPVNHQPTLDAIANLSIAEDTGQQTVNLAGITAGRLESQPLRITAISDQTGLIPNPAITYTSEESTGTINFTPVAEQSGKAKITVTVIDAGLDGIDGNDDDASRSRFFHVTVNPKTEDVSPSGTARWKFRAKGRIMLSSPAIGADGTVCFGSSDGYVYAVDGQTGVEKWKVQTGGAVNSSPAIGADGMVYFGSQDGCVYAVNGEIGVEKWSFKTDRQISSSPTISHDGNIYIGSDDSIFYALDSENGEERGRFVFKGPVRSVPAIGADRTVYIGSDDNKMYAVVAGLPVSKWSLETGGEVWSSPAVGSDGAVYVGSADGYLYAVNGKTGDEKWKIQTGGAVNSSPSIGSDGTVYFGSDDAYVYAVNGTTGGVKWKVRTGRAVFSSPAIGDDGTIYVGSLDGKVYALDGKNGVKKWELETDGSVYSSPAIGADGTVYIGSYDGYLYAIRSDSGGLAKSPWPMRGQNVRHTGHLSVDLVAKPKPKPKPLPAVVARNLEAYYPFQGDADDTSENAHHGAVLGAKPATDRFGVADRAYEFSGPKTRIEIPERNRLSDLTNFTISAWFKWDPDQETTKSFIISKSNANNQEQLSYQLYVDRTNPLAQSGDLRAKVGYRSSAPVLLLSATKVTAGQWYAVTFTYSAGAKIATLYLDGKKVAGRSQVKQPDLNGPAPVTIGRWHGSLDEICIFSRRLLKEEVESLYLSEVDLTGSWKSTETGSVYRLQDDGRMIEVELVKSEELLTFEGVLQRRWVTLNSSLWEFKFKELGDQMLVKGKSRGQITSKDKIELEVPFFVEENGELTEKPMQSTRWLRQP